MLEAQDKDVHKHISGLLDKFKQKCQGEGIVHQEAKFQRIPSEGILHESIFYDLVIIGLHTYFDFEVSNRTGANRSCRLPARWCQR